MIAHSVIHRARRDACSPEVLLSGSRWPMVIADVFGKCASLPTFHPGADHGNAVDSAEFDWRISADRFKAFPAKYLACAGHMIAARKTVVVGLAGCLHIRCADNSKLRIGVEFPQQE